MIIAVRITGISYLAVSAAGTFISMRDELPVNFAGWSLASGNMTRDFLIGAGTALAAPLPALIVLGLLLVLGSRPTPTGRIALALLIVFAVGMIVGIVGEPVARDALDEAGAHVDRTVIVIAGLVLPLVMGACSQAAYQLHRRGEPL